MKVDPYTYPATDWFDLYFRDAFMQEHNIRISGGNDHIQTGLSVGYLDQEGVVNFTDAKKVSINFNSTIKYGQFKAGINVSANYRNYNEPHTGISDYMQLGMRALPVMTPYLADGSYGRSWVVTPGQNTFNNLLSCKDGENNYKQTRIVGSAFAEYIFPYDIKYNITLGVRKVDLTRRYFQPTTYTYNPKTLEPQKMIANTTAMNAANDDINPSISQTVNWNRSFNGKHNIAALLGMNYEEFNAWSFSAKGQDGYLDNELTEVGLATTFLKPSSSSSKVRLLSYFGRINYDYADRYLFEANLRYDGSSRFAPETRWGNFWSLGTSWRIDRESFMASTTNWLSALTLKMSYGAQGNDNLGTYYASKGLYSIVSNLGENALVSDRMATPNLKWETNLNFNVGIDFSLFNNRFSGSFDFFTRRSKDLLYSRPIAPSLGYGSIDENVGALKNTGIEMVLNGTIINQNGWVWKLGMNLSLIHI